MDEPPEDEDEQEDEQEEEQEEEQGEDKPRKAASAALAYFTRQIF